MEKAHNSPSICIVGAGFSGLTAGLQLKRELKVTSFTIFDENAEIGGTWLKNAYAGAACDAPSHLYSWSFAMNADWEESYSSHAHILHYMKTVVEKNDLRRHIQLNTCVVSLRWVESLHQWEVLTRTDHATRHTALHFDFVINGVGGLRVPFYPIEFKAFTGPVMHSAEWDPTLELEGKVVGVVGSGATAVQIIPAIANKVKALHSYQRSPAYVVRRNQFRYPRFVKRAFHAFPLLMWLHRFFHFLAFDFVLHWAFKHNSFFNKMARKSSLKFMRSQLPDKRYLWKELEPNYAFGCKRCLVHSGYYPTFNLSHVHLHTGTITRIHNTTVHSQDGQAQDLDVLILATGFQFQDYFAPMKIYDEDSADLCAAWKEDGPSAYLGISTHRLPNHFFLLGPNTVLGHNSVLHMIEAQVSYVVKVLKEMRLRQKRVVRPQRAAERAYMDALHAGIKGSVFGKGGCVSWYLDGRGRVTATYPWKVAYYWTQTATLKLNDFEFI